MNLFSKLSIKMFANEDAHIVPMIQRFICKGFLQLKIKLFSVSINARNVVIIGLPAVAGRVLWIRVRRSVFQSGSFLGIGSLVFSKTQHSVRGPCLVVRDRADFLKILFLPQKWGKWAKNKVFWIYWKIWSLIFFWIWSIKKHYKIFCILAQIPYLGKICFLRYGPKCSRPIRLQYF